MKYLTEYQGKVIKGDSIKDVLDQYMQESCQEDPSDVEVYELARLVTVETTTKYLARFPKTTGKTG